MRHQGQIDVMFDRLVEELPGLGRVRQKKRKDKQHERAPTVRSLVAAV